MHLLPVLFVIYNNEFIHWHEKYSNLSKVTLIILCVMHCLCMCVCVCLDRAGEPALIPGGVPAAVSQTGRAGAGGAFCET